MSNIKFINTNFDPAGSSFLQIAEAMAKAYGYTAQLSIDKELAQLIRLRIALVNQCSYCTILHAAHARSIGIEQTQIDTLNNYWISQLYTEKEKAVLAYADKLNDGKESDFDQYHDKLKQFYSDNEIAEIAYITINMNIWIRLRLARSQVRAYIQ